MRAYNRQEVTMLKKLLIAAAGILVSVPALADGGPRDHGRPWGHWKRPYYARPLVVPAPRVVYAPPPRVYYAPPAPVYYDAPPPVVYPEPVPQSSVSIRLRFPL